MIVIIVVLLMVAAWVIIGLGVGFSNWWRFYGFHWDEVLPLMIVFAVLGPFALPLWAGSRKEIDDTDCGC